MTDEPPRRNPTHAQGSEQIMRRLGELQDSFLQRFDNIDGRLSSADDRMARLERDSAKNERERSSLRNEIAEVRLAVGEARELTRMSAAELKEGQATVPFQAAASGAAQGAAEGVSASLAKTSGLNYGVILLAFVTAAGTIVSNGGKLMSWMLSIWGGLSGNTTE